MEFLKQLVPLMAFIGAMGLAPAAMAERAPGGPEAKDLILKGDAKCTGCHDEADEPSPTMLELHPGVLSIAKSRHGVKADSRTPTCTDCHGESEKHLNYKGKDKPPKPDRVFTKSTPTSAEGRNEACLSCHKGGKRSHWEGSQHAGQDLACTSCHRIHVQRDKVLGKATQSEVCFTCHKSERAQTHRTSTHPLDAGKMACSDCHNPHGSTGPKMLVKNSVNETCYTCHAEKRGPFLWEHFPATDDCTTCHTPHGSSNTPLLKARTPYLCQQCHQDHGNSLKGGFSVADAPGTPTSNTVINANTAGKYLTIQGNGRMCVNCHVMVHGSNHPAGAVLTR